MGNENFDQLLKEVEPDKVNRLKKELPPHKVVISKDFWLATTEVTQGLWLKIMGTRPSWSWRWKRKNWEQLPVTKVNWLDAKAFIKKLNALDDGYRYRLPTEAEWEYAARAGTRGLRPFPYDDMDEYAWFRTSSGDQPQPVATLKPNAWGLYDMIGNVWEWTEDSFSANYYSESPVVDPKGPKLSPRKVMRGGSYHCTPERVRVGIRGINSHNRKIQVLGFRMAADKL